jgi:hypothetical protein
MMDPMVINVALRGTPNDSDWIAICGMESACPISSRSD